MVYALIILLIAINISPLIIFPETQAMNSWQSQGYFCAFGISIMLALTQIFKKNKIEIKNKPLSYLFIWVVLSSFYLVYQEINKPQYTYFNAMTFICIIYFFIFYNIITSYIKSTEIFIILNFLKYLTILFLIIAVLQKFGLGQFFFTNKTIYEPFNPIVGFVFNSTLFSSLLGMLSALFWNKFNTINILCLILTFIILSFCGTLINKMAYNGFILFFFSGLYMNWGEIRSKFYLFFIIIPIVLILKFHSIAFLSNGRLEIYSFWWKIFTTISFKDIVSGPITGLGLGIVDKLAPSLPIPDAHSLHNEPFQIMVELGIVGFILFFWVVIDLLNKNVFTNNEKILKCIVISFLISGLLNPTFHVWIIALYGVCCYSLLIVSVNEKNITHNSISIN